MVAVYVQLFENGVIWDARKSTKLLNYFVEYWDFVAKSFQGVCFTLQYNIDS